MSNTENIENLTPEVVVVESEDSTSSSIEKMLEEDNDISSEESVGSKKEKGNTSATDDGIFVASVAQTSTRTSYANLTIPVATPLDPLVPKTIYVGVTATGFNTRDILDPTDSNRDIDDNDYEEFDNAPKTKKQLSGDFALKENQVTSKWSSSTIDMDESRFRMSRLPICPPMIDYFIPIPVEHFHCGLRLPLDPTFCDFLHSIRSQPAHIHPNGIRYFFSLVVLCRRIGVEVSDLILCTFFSILRMNNLTLSLRPRKNIVTLFESAPNKISSWRERWVCIESNLGFPFYPKRKSLLLLSKVYKRTKYSDSDKKFLDYVRSELGESAKNQTKIFYTRDLLENSSRHFCGIGGLRTDARRSELGLEDKSEYPMWKLHPNRVFSTECPECSDP